MSSGHDYYWLDGNTPMKRIEYSQLRTQYLEFPLPIAVPVLSIGAVGLQDLDADGDLDIVTQLDNTVYTFVNTPILGVPTYALGSSFTAPNGEVYTAFNTLDINNDGILDILGIGSGGQADAFIGTQEASAITYTYNGNNTLYGFPTADETDGKFVGIVGAGLATISVPTASYFIELAGNGTSAPKLVVDVYDGDLGGLNDVGTGNTCYRLYEASNKQSSGGNLLISKTSAGMADSAWSNLYTGTALASAQGASGDYFYRLDVSLADDCNGNQLSTDNIDNNFKIRSNGQIGKELGDVLFEGADSDGEFAAVTSSSYGDYDYNGSFDFYIDVGQNGVVNPDPAAGEDTGSKELVLFDFDADDLDNTKYPGVADGANHEIGWQLFDPGGYERLYANVVSGNYPTGEEGSKYPTIVDRAGTWTWHWHDVLTANAVNIQQAASPTQYAMYGARVHRRTVSDALPPAGWTSANLDNYFTPVVLGSKNSCATAADRLAVPDTTAAQTILASSTSLYADLQAEVLAAKLNIQRSAGRIAGLDDAIVYGRSLSVKHAVAQAEAVLGAGASGTTAAQVRDALRLMRGINHGEITFAGARALTSVQGGLDTDGDGIRDEVDNCAAVANPGQRDYNLDGIGDVCDPVPTVACVAPNGQGGFTAYFDLSNAGPTVQIMRGSQNAVMGSTARPPVLMPDGTTQRALVADSSGAPIVWSVYQNSATASLSSPKCLTLNAASLRYGSQAVLYASDELRIQNNVSVSDCSDVVNAGTGQTFVSAGAHVGDVYSRGPVQMDSGSSAMIVSAAGPVQKQATTETQGVLSVSAASFAPFSWSVDFPAGNWSTVNLEPDTQKTIGPGSFAAVSVKSRSTLHLRSGAYYFASLTLEPDATLALDASNGTVTIYVRDDLTFRGTVTGVTRASDLVLASFGTNMVPVESSLRGTILVPNAQLVLGSSPARTYRGRFVARRIEVRAGSIVTLE